MSTSIPRDAARTEHHWSDEDVNDAAKAMLEDISECSLMRMATLQAAAMLIAAYASEWPDPREGLRTLLAEFAADAEELTTIIGAIEAGLH